MILECLKQLLLTLPALCWSPAFFLPCTVYLSVALSLTTEERSWIQLYPGKSGWCSSLCNIANNIQPSSLSIVKVITGGSSVCLIEHAFIPFCIMSEVRREQMILSSTCGTTRTWYALPCQYRCHRYNEERFMFVSTMKVRLLTLLCPCLFIDATCSNSFSSGHDVPQAWGVPGSHHPISQTHVSQSPVFYQWQRVPHRLLTRQWELPGTLWDTAVIWLLFTRDHSPSCG